MTFTRGSSQPRYQMWVSHIVGRFFTIWATWQAPYNILHLIWKILVNTSNNTRRPWHPTPVLLPWEKIEAISCVLNMRFPFTPIKLYHDKIYTNELLTCLPFLIFSSVQNFTPMTALKHTVYYFRDYKSFSLWVILTILGLSAKYNIFTLLIPEIFDILIFMGFHSSIYFFSQLIALPSLLVPHYSVTHLRTDYSVIHLSTDVLQWTWIWLNSRRQGRTGKPGLLKFMGLQRIRHNLAREQQKSTNFFFFLFVFLYSVNLNICWKCYLL